MKSLVETRGIKAPVEEEIPGEDQERDNNRQKWNLECIFILFETNIFPGEDQRRHQNCSKNRIARWIEVLSAHDFVAEYHPGVKHGNADAMSRRCENPQECKCPLVDEEQNLLCGPCHKCRKRSQDMQSTLLDGDGKCLGGDGKNLQD